MIHYQHGWFQVGYERDFGKPINAIEIGERALMLACVEGQWCTFDAYCPHRGAHLAHGGRIEGERRMVVCPFHEYQIGLGQCSANGFKVQEYPTMVLAGLVFVRLSEGHDFGFEAALRRLVADHVIVPGFELSIRAPSQLIIENGFDNRHFLAVHGTCNDPRFTVSLGAEGELVTEGVFEIPASEWRPNSSGPKRAALAPYQLRAYSPGVTLGRLQGQFPYTLITAATPTPVDNAELRLSLALPIAHFGSTPRKELYEALLRHTQAGLEQDRAIWDHMQRGYTQRLLPGDHAVQRFQEFCAQFA